MSTNRRIKRKRNKTADYLEKIVHEVYAVHHIMHAAHIEPDDIYLQVANIINAIPPGLYVTVLARKGIKEYRIHTLQIKETQIKPFETAWVKFCALKPSLPKQFLDDLVRQTEAYQHHKLEILTGLTLEGISGPLADLDQTLN